MCANPVLEFPNITVEGGLGRYEVLGSIGMRVWQRVIGEAPWMCGGEFRKDTNHITEDLDKKCFPLGLGQEGILSSTLL